jgi:hypothetical protein
MRRFRLLTKPHHFWWGLFLLCSSTGQGDWLDEVRRSAAGVGAGKSSQESCRTRVSGSNGTENSFYGPHCVNTDLNPLRCPSSEVVIHRSPDGELSRKQAPLTTCHERCAWSAAKSRHWQHRLNERPGIIAQIGIVNSLHSQVAAMPPAFRFVFWKQGFH